MGRSSAYRSRSLSRSPSPRGERSRRKRSRREKSSGDSSVSPHRRYSSRKRRRPERRDYDFDDRRGRSTREDSSELSDRSHEGHDSAKRNGRKNGSERHKDWGRESDRNHKRGAGRESKREEAKHGDGVEKEDPSGPLGPETVKTLKGFQKGVFGGVYIPPFRLAQMMQECDDKSGQDYQRLTWDALRKSLNGIINKVNAANMRSILPELFSENLIRGRGLFCRAVMKSQMASPTFTPVYSALVAVVNTKFPEIGELLLKRVILQFKRGYRRNEKAVCIAATQFLAHLMNQGVAHELLILELLMVLLENPSNDGVDVAVSVTKEVGAALQELSPQGLHSIFERLRAILHEGEIDKRVQFMIEGLFAVRKSGFEKAGYPAIQSELDLVEEEDQITHEITLEEELQPETNLDVFKFDPDIEQHDKEYETIKKEILGESSEDEDGGGDGEGEEESDDSSDDSDDDDDEEKMEIQDMTDTDIVNLRRTIYLTIMSSLNFEEAGHKLLSIKLKPGQECEITAMIIECCSQERTYLRYYGLLAQRFAMMGEAYRLLFEESFTFQYSIIHRLETNKLRNNAKLSAHLLATDAISWSVLSCIRLTEEDTTSSARIFIKILFQELSEILGLIKMNERLQMPEHAEWYDQIFPKDTAANMRFSINFFTSIGLGGLTDKMRELLKELPRIEAERRQAAEAEESSSSESSESSSTSGSSSSSESSSSSSGSSSTSSGSSDSDSRDTASS